jgi:hypothetical protein
MLVKNIFTSSRFELSLFKVSGVIHVPNLYDKGHLFSGLLYKSTINNKMLLPYCLRGGTYDF